jgi:hypothetical protein
MRLCSAFLSPGVSPDAEEEEEEDDDTTGWEGNAKDAASVARLGPVVETKPKSIKLT